MSWVLVFAMSLALGPLDWRESGVDVIRAMHDRYASKWYDTLILAQTVNYYASGTGALDSARVWYESIKLPGVVRSDVAPLDNGNGEVFRDDSVYIFEGDSIVRSRPALHPVLILGFDIYVQPVEETVAKLEQFGFELDKLGEAEWEGRPVHVVGAASGDEIASQFWVDMENLLCVKLVAVNRTTGVIREVQFKSYEPLGGGWIATELVFLRDGQVTISERYNFWEIDVDLDPRLFATRERARPTWVRN